MYATTGYRPIGVFRGFSHQQSKLDLTPHSQRGNIYNANTGSLRSSPPRTLEVYTMKELVVIAEELTEEAKQKAFTSGLAKLNSCNVNREKRKKKYLVKIK